MKPSSTPKTRPAPPRTPKYHGYIRGDMIEPLLDEQDAELAEQVAHAREAGAPNAATCTTLLDLILEIKGRRRSGETDWLATGAGERNDGTRNGMHLAADHLRARISELLDDR